jgi:hypothetical protein
MEIVFYIAGAVALWGVLVALFFCSCGINNERIDAELRREERPHA